MNKIAALVLLAFVVSCSRADNGDADVPVNYKLWRDELCQKFDPMTITRCDRATFHVLMNAMCGKPLPTEYEFPYGKWNRDINPCYPNDSSSETSFDTYLSVVMSHNEDAIKRIVTYAKPLKWETGAPAGGVGNIITLVPLLRSLLQKPETLSFDAISGHRGHLIAGWLWEWSYLNDGLLPVEVEILRQIADKTPSSPYFSCLYRRFSGKDQSHTLDLLEKVHTKSTFGWGSSVGAIHVALTVACLEGR